MTSDAEVCWMKSVSRPVRDSGRRDPLGDFAREMVKALAARGNFKGVVHCLHSTVTLLARLRG